MNVNQNIKDKTKWVSEVAKYDWKQLEKEYILGNYKSVSSFLKDKGIKQNGSTKKSTKGWKGKKVLKEEQKSTKVIEKVLEKESEKEANKIIQVKDVANDLLSKIVQANNELNMHIARNKKKTKTVEYNYDMCKPSKETINEEEEIKSYIDIIDRKGLKELTSALKDLNDILDPKEDDNDEDNSFIEALNQKTEDIWNEEG